MKALPPHESILVNAPLVNEDAMKRVSWCWMSPGFCLKAFQHIILFPSSWILSYQHNIQWTTRHTKILKINPIPVLRESWHPFWCRWWSLPTPMGCLTMIVTQASIKLWKGERWDEVIKKLSTSGETGRGCGSGRGASVEHEYYESFYRNMTDNINLSNFKDSSRKLLHRLWHKHPFN